MVVVEMVVVMNRDEMGELNCVETGKCIFLWFRNRRLGMVSQAVFDVTVILTIHMTVVIIEINSSVGIYLCNVSYGL